MKYTGQNNQSMVEPNQWNNKQKYTFWWLGHYIGTDDHVWLGLIKKTDKVTVKLMK